MRRRVLLADDEEAVLALVEATLGNDGSVEVLLARDGVEALQIARSWKPDLIFLDVMMPHKNGYQVCSELKGDRETAGIKVVMLTGLSEDFDRTKARQIGADGYMSKPFSPMEMLETFDELLAAA